MGNTAKIVAAAIGGYVLGRKKKLKLAIGLGLYLGAKKLDIKPQQLAQGLLKDVSALPVVGELKEQSREQLLNAGKTAAGNLANKWAGSLADSLNDRTEQLRGTAETVSDAGEGVASTVSGDEEGEEDTTAATDEDTEAPEEADAEEAPTAKKKSSRGSSGTAKRASGTAKRTTGGASKTARRRSSTRRSGEGRGDGRD